MKEGKNMKDLFSPFSYKGLELKNRVVMPPMCQYSVEKKDGIATDWHYVHYVSRAIGGAGLIIIEMTDVEPDGRIKYKNIRDANNAEDLILYTANLNYAGFA